MDIINRISKSFSDLTIRGKKETLEDALDKFEGKINKIVNDLIEPYTENKKVENKKYIELLNLLDPKKCNKVAITMASNLEKNYTAVELEGYAQKVFVGQEKGEDCLNDTCEQLNKIKLKGKTKDIPKKELCNAISLHYVKILNLIAAILTAINPVYNLCIKRLNDLFYLIDKDSRVGISKVCDSSMVEKSILEVSGVKELLILYYFYHINDIKNPAAKRQLNMQFKKLIYDLEKLTYDPEEKIDEDSVSVLKDIDDNKSEPTSPSNIRYELDKLKSKVDKINSKNGNIASLNDEISTLSNEISDYQSKNNNTEYTPTNEESSSGMVNKIIDNDDDDNYTNSNEMNEENDTFENSSLVDTQNDTQNEGNEPIINNPNSVDIVTEDNSEIIDKYGYRPKTISEIQAGGDDKEPLLEESVVNNSEKEHEKIFGDLDNGIDNIDKTLLTPNDDDMENMESKKSNKAIKKFIEFTERYQPVKEINPQVMSIVKRSFKTSDGTAFTDQQFQSFCAKHDNLGNGININVDDQKFMKYIAVFKEMKEYYIKTCNTLLDILEDEILVLHKTNSDDKDDEGEYKLRNIQYEELSMLESKVRLTVGELYVKCNQYYYLGVNELYVGLTGPIKEI
jgi:hypothetical protein